MKVHTRNSERKRECVCICEREYIHVYIHTYTYIHNRYIQYQLCVNPMIKICLTMSPLPHHTVSIIGLFSHMLVFFHTHRSLFHLVPRDFSQNASPLINIHSSTQLPTHPTHLPTYPPTHPRWATLVDFRRQTYRPTDRQKDEDREAET